MYKFCFCASKLLPLQGLDLLTLISLGKIQKGRHCIFPAEDGSLFGPLKLRAGSGITPWNPSPLQSASASLLWARLHFNIPFGRMLNLVDLRTVEFFRSQCLCSQWWELSPNLFLCLGFTKNITCIRAAYKTQSSVCSSYTEENWNSLVVGLHCAII